MHKFVIIFRASLLMCIHFFDAFKSRYLIWCRSTFSLLFAVLEISISYFESSTSSLVALAPSMSGPVSTEEYWLEIFLLTFQLLHPSFLFINTNITYRIHYTIENYIVISRLFLWIFRPVFQNLAWLFSQFRISLNDFWNLKVFGIYRFILTALFLIAM